MSDDLDNDFDDPDDDFTEASKAKPRKYLLIIDDTLDMELQKHRLIRRSDQIDEIAQKNKFSADVRIRHVRSKQSAIRQLEYLKDDGVKPEDIIVISDYKLQAPEEAEEWGPDILQAIAANQNYRPSHLFLMSKSGFRGEDQAKLDAIGAQYFHANELFYIAAEGAGNEALKEVFSQRSKTHNFREWCNQNLGASFRLAQYRSPNIQAREKGRIPVIEVVRHIKQGNITHAEAMQLLDEESVRTAFRNHVNAAGIPHENTAHLEYGVEGPSVQGRLAFSEEDIRHIRTEAAQAPIVLVLDHDYGPQDNALIAQANAVVMLAKGTQHIQVLAKNQHIPVLFANRGKYTDLSVRDNTLQKHDGPMPPSAFANAGDWVTVDGAKHVLYSARLPIESPSPETWEAALEMARIGDYHNRLTWHFDSGEGKLIDHSGVRVMANADNAEQAAEAKKNPAVQGIGLLRTEHMFLSENRRLLLIKALLAEGSAKAQALEELTQEHTRDLEPIFALQTKDFPVTVRLFDFPPAEFFPLPADSKAIAELAKTLGEEEDKVRKLCDRIHNEQLRGAAFAIAFPEITQAQCKAICAATGTQTANIMIPVVRSPQQVSTIRKMIDGISAPNGFYRLGAMVETRELTPKSFGLEYAESLMDVVKQCDFIRLGTNDLTEEVLGVKRGDHQAILEWNHKSREPINPFDALSHEVKVSIERILWAARQINPKLEICLCGDQAADRATAEFCQQCNLGALSVPATPEMLTQALVETGRAALLESIAQREMREREMRAKENAERARTEGKLPDTVHTPSRHVLEKSPAVFIFLDDEDYSINKYKKQLAGHPVIVCETVSDALKAIDAMHVQGKEVHLYADANVPLHGWEDNQRHPLCDEVREMSSKNGVALACYIASGKLQNMKPENVTILTAAIEYPPQGIKCFEKGYRDDEWLKQQMDDVIERTNFARNKPDKCVVVVDDEPAWAARCKRVLELRFNCQVEIFPRSEGVLARIKQGGVAAVITDQLMPDGTGQQLAEAMRKETPDVPVAVITSSDEFGDAHPDGLPGNVPVMPKSELGYMEIPSNKLRTFLVDAFGGPGRGKAA